MVKCNFFCDRCKHEVESEYALRKIVIERDGDNPLKMDLCRYCIKALADFAVEPIKS